MTPARKIAAAIARRSVVWSMILRSRNKYRSKKLWRRDEQPSRVSAIATQHHFQSRIGGARQCMGDAASPLFWEGQRSQGIGGWGSRSLPMWQCPIGRVHASKDRYQA